MIDLPTKKKLRNFTGHTGRIGSLNWGANLLASGSKDGHVGIWDMRSELVNRYRAHSQ